MALGADTPVRPITLVIPTAGRNLQLTCVARASSPARVCSCHRASSKGTASAVQKRYAPDPRAVAAQLPVSSHATRKRSSNPSRLG